MGCDLVFLVFIDHELFYFISIRTTYCFVGDVILNSHVNNEVD
jgi:hypothetical protein